MEAIGEDTSVNYSGQLLRTMPTIRGRRASLRRNVRSAAADRAVGRGVGCNVPGAGVAGQLLWRPVLRNTLVNCV